MNSKGSRVIAKIANILSPLTVVLQKQVNSHDMQLNRVLLFGVQILLNIATEPTAFSACD